MHGILRMRRFSFRAVLVLFFLLSLATAKAQVTLAEKRLKENQTSLPVYTAAPAAPGRELVYLQTPFAKASFIDPAQVDLLRGKVIEKVELVYTAFAVSPNFDQQGLNRSRLRTLHAALPAAFSTLTGWQLSAQTSASNADSARKLFHGFVVTCRTEPTPESMAMEIEALKNALGDPAASASPSSSSSSSASTSSSNLRFTALQIAMHRLGSNAGITLDSTRCRVVKVTDQYTLVEMHYRFQSHKRKRIDTVSNTQIDTTASLNTRMAVKFPDSVITTVLRRNTHWKNMVIVCDLTGSMSPYTAQLFDWFREAAAEKRVKAFYFFNDGDGKLNRKKEIGSTGGIHYTASMSPDTVLQVALATMKAGTGGDAEENNLEALLQAIQKSDSTAEFIMIADNHCVPRDMPLLKEVTRPVHIIACGSNYGINPMYLKIARYTNGSLHTMRLDIEGLGQLEDGDVITIGKERFRIKGYNFFSGDGN